MFDAVRTIIRRKEVKRRTGNPSDATLWRWEKAGIFPQRIQLTEGGSVGWYEDEIDGWVRDRIRAGGKRPVNIAASQAPERQSA